MRTLFFCGFLGVTACGASVVVDPGTDATPSDATTDTTVSPPDGSVADASGPPPTYPLATPDEVCDGVPGLTGAALIAAIKDPGVTKKLNDIGFEVVGNTPAEFTAFFRAEAAKWADVAKKSGTTVD